MHDILFSLYLLSTDCYLLVVVTLVTPVCYIFIIFQLMKDLRIISLHFPHGEGYWSILLYCRIYYITWYYITYRIGTESHACAHISIISIFQSLGIGTNYFTVSSPRGECSMFRTAEANHTVSFNVPPGIYYCWVARENVESKLAQGFYTWPMPGIKPQISWSLVQSLNHSAMYSILFHCKVHDMFL
jgi:hypothetical protein